MKQFWKKGIAILLVLVSVLSLCACGADNTPSDSETPAIGNEESTDKTPENLNVPFYSNGLNNIDVSLLSAQPYEDDDVYVEITGIKYNRNEDQSLPGWSLIFYCKIENRTAHTMEVEGERAYINGYFCNLLEPKDNELQPGETKDFYVYVRYEQFERNGISEIGDGICVLEITYGGRNWIRATMPFITKESYTQQQYTDGNVIYEKNGLKIVEQGYGEWTDDCDTHVRFYVENNSDKTYEIDILDNNNSRFSGTGVYSWLYVAPGTTGVLYYDFSYPASKSINKNPVPVDFLIYAEEDDDGFYYICEIDKFTTQPISFETMVVTK